MAKKAIRSNAQLARPGDKYLISGPGFWGKGKTISEASDNAPHSFDNNWILYSVGPDTRINDCGFWRGEGTADDREPIEIDRASSLRQIA